MIYPEDLEDYYQEAFVEERLRNGGLTDRHWHLSTVERLTEDAIPGSSREMIHLLAELHQNVMYVRLDEYHSTLADAVYAAIKRYFEERLDTKYDELVNEYVCVECEEILGLEDMFNEKICHLCYEEMGNRS